MVIEMCSLPLEALTIHCKRQRGHTTCKCLVIGGVVRIGPRRVYEIIQTWLQRSRPAAEQFNAPTTLCRLLRLPFSALPPLALLPNLSLSLKPHIKVPNSNHNLKGIFPVEAQTHSCVQVPTCIPNSCSPSVPPGSRSPFRLRSIQLIAPRPVARCKL